MYDYQMVESISERLEWYIKDAAESLNIKSEVKVSLTMMVICEGITSLFAPIQPWGVLRVEGS